jgi:hypothetical protein
VSGNPSLSELLQELRASGQVDSQGRFTLDVAKAREKMKKYQLADPYHYVLAVVRAAVAAGAHRVVVRCDANDCHLLWEGPGLEAALLEQLFSALFLPRDESLEPLRELAIAANAALGLDPAWVRVETWTGQGGARLELWPSGQKFEPLSLQSESPRPTGVAIHVRERHALRVLKKILAGWWSMPEAAALQRCCRLAPIPVEVNGRLVNGEADLGPCLLTRRFRQEGVEALVGLPLEAPDISHLDIVLHGVTLSRKAVKLGTVPEVAGVVWAGHLTRNLSSSDVVEDAHYARLLTLVRAFCRELVAELARTCGPDEMPPARRRAVLGTLHRAMARGLQHSPGWRRWKEYKQALLEAPAFRQPDGRPLTLRALMEEYDRLGFLPVCRSPWAHPLPDGTRVVLLEDDPGVEQVLQKVFPRLREMDDHFRKVARYLARMEGWKRLAPRRPCLELGGYLARVELSNLPGEAALPATPGLGESAGHLMLLKSFRPLGSIAMDRPGWPWVWGIVNHDGLEVDLDWKPLPGPALEEAVAAVEEAVPRLFSRLAAALPPDEPARGWARFCLRAYLRYLVLQGVSYQGPDSLPEALAQAPLYDALGGRPVTLAEVARKVESQGQVAWAERARGHRQDLDLGRLVLLLEPADLEGLQGYFGADRLHDAGAELSRLSGRQAFLRRPVRTLQAAAEAVGALEFSGPQGLRGQVALPWHPEGQGISLVILQEGRELARRTLFPDMPGLAAVVEAPGLTATPDWSDVLEDQAYYGMVEEVRTAARRLPLALAGLDPLPEVALEHIWRHLAWESGPGCDGFTQRLDPIRRQLLELAVFPRAEGVRACLKEILDEVNRRGHVGFVEEPVEAADTGGELLLLVPGRRAPLLRAILGTYRVKPRGAEVKARVRARRLKEGPQVERLELSGNYLARACLAGEAVVGAPLEGQIGLWPDPASTSRLHLHLERRPLATVEIPGLVPGFEAIVDCASLSPTSDFADVKRDRAFEQLVQKLAARAAGLAAELARTPSEGPRRYLLTLAGHLAGRLENPAPDSLEQALLDYPFFPTLQGPTATLGQVLALRRGRQALPYLPAGHPFSAEEGAQVPDPLPVLTVTDRELLSRVSYPLEDLTPALKTLQAARVNRARPRLSSLTLEEVFPQERWLARLALEGDLQGELGLGRGAHSPSVVVAVDGLPLARLDLHPGSGVSGVVAGPFAPTPDWSGLADPGQVRALLEKPLRRLMGQLLARFPEPDHPDFARARQAVLGWTEWRQVLQQGPLRNLEAAMSRLGLFPLPGGRYASLQAVADEVRRRQHLTVCRPDEEPPAEDELVLAVEPDSEVWRFLSRLAPSGLRPWQRSGPEVPTAQEGPPVPAPAPQRGREEEVPPPPGQGPADPARRLLEALRTELRLLRDTDSLPLEDSVIEGMTLGPTPRGTFCTCKEGRLTLNPAHPVVARLLATPELPPERLYFLLSGIYSVLNRARKDIEDLHERRFHARILAALLGGGQGS